MQNLSTDLELRPLNRLCYAIHQQTGRVVPFGGLENSIFTSSPSRLKPPKKTILGTYNGKPTGNTYSHNCIMMHKDTTLKFGWLYNLSKYLEHT